VTPWLIVRSGWPGTLLRVSTELVVRLRSVPQAAAWASLCTLVAGGGALWRLQANRRRTMPARSD
jgi:hypothetical protein